MKILHVIDSGGFYGAERVLLNIAVETCWVGHEAIIGTIVAPQDEDDPLYFAAMEEGIAARQFHSPDGYRPALTGMIARYAYEEKIDVIHAHGYRANIQLATARPGLLPCPVVASLHGWTAITPWSRMGLYETLERLLVGRLGHIVVVSRGMGERLPRWVAGSKLSVVPNGIDLRTARWPGLPGNSSDHSSEFRLLAVGRLSAEKAFDLLLSAVARLRPQYAGLRLEIMGEGPERKALEAEIRRLSLEQIVRLSGYVPDARARMREFDLLVISSRTEGHPAVLLEAMAEGLPVVATAVGAIPEIGEQGAGISLVRAGQMNELADAIAEAIDSATCRQTLSERAFEIVRQRYARESMGRQYLDIYRRVVMRGRPA